MKIKEIRSILSAIEKELLEFSYQSNSRLNLSVALLDLSLEHAKSIVMLIEKSLLGSAYALSRPMYECFIKGEWVKECATDEQIAKIGDKDKWPKKSLKELAQTIEQKNNWPDRLTFIASNLLQNMHSYTHGGVQLTARRFAGDFLYHEPKKDEINALFCMIGMISYLSFTGLLDVSQGNHNKEAVDKIRNLIINDLLDIDVK